MDYNKCIPTRITELQQPEVSYSSPNSNDYLVRKNIINYILREHEIKDVMRNNTLLAKIWNECNNKSENNTICDSTTAPFNILDSPIEIEGSTFMFTENELGYSGVDVFNENNIIDSNVEHLNLDLMVKKKNECSNIFDGKALQTTVIQLIQGSSVEDSNNYDTVVGNSTEILDDVNIVNNENTFDNTSGFVENTKESSGAKKNKETDQYIQTRTPTQLIWDNHFKWPIEDNSDLQKKKKISITCSICYNFK